MKKYITFLAMALAAQSVLANGFYQQLCDFNDNWKKYEKHVGSIETLKFNSDAEYIQAHLGQVISILKSNSIESLSVQQKKNRFLLVSMLMTYRERGRFPQNYYRENRVPVFIDEHNTHCAVGYLLERTGNDELAKEIARTNNYAWVKEIDNQALIRWQEKSGLTLEELKLIQGAYDFYPELNLHDPNKYEIPQKPEFMTLYFDEEQTKKSIWCKGEGKDGILHGRWEQNYSKTLPWIVGFFNKGKRTGQWKEYYQGTDKLCRTENWRNNKLNGVRKRFNKSGEIIEEILFKNGEAVTKTNYDLFNSLKFIRTPLDSNVVWTEVYTLGGSVLASGMERIHNPGNLMWFQNIELTALNTAAITSRDLQSTSNFRGNDMPVYMNPESGTGLYNAPPLVEYKKEGEWIYYKDFTTTKNREGADKNLEKMLVNDYSYLAQNMNNLHSYFQEYTLNEYYDSLVIEYKNNNIEDLRGYSDTDLLHVSVQYYPEITNPLFAPIHYFRDFRFEVNVFPRVKMIGKYNEREEKIGTWKYFTENKQLFKSVTYIIPWKEEEVDFILSERN